MWTKVIHTGIEGDKVTRWLGIYHILSAVFKPSVEIDSDNLIDEGYEHVNQEEQLHPMGIHLI